MAKVNKNKLKEIALQRVNDLMKEAKDNVKEDKELSRKYVQLARKIAMKVNLRLPKEIKIKFCKYCDSYWTPGKNLRVRVDKNKIIYYCLDCKHFRRYGK
jgi:ribonuclease P protein subunit RPR2